MFNSLGVLNNQICCNVVSKFYFLQKKSHIASNNFVCEVCNCTFQFGDRLKNHICFLRVSKNATYPLTIPILWEISRVISIAIMHINRKNFQSQVLLFQMILCATFALVNSELLRD